MLIARDGSMPIKAPAIVADRNGDVFRCPIEVNPDMTRPSVLRDIG